LRIRWQDDPTRVVVTLAGSLDPGSADGAPTGVAVSGSDLYITMSTAVAVVRNRP
jgi:hypothetical protein